MQASRADLSQFSVVFDVDRFEPDGHVGQRWSVAWGIEGFRVDVATPFANSPAFPEDHQVRVVDVSAEHAVIYDGVSSAEVSSSTAQLGFQFLLPDYCGFLGRFDTRLLAGGEPLFNDPVELLGTDEAWIAPDEVQVGGQNCIVIEWRPAVEGGAVAALRGYYATGLGFAQMRLESLRPDGHLSSAWETTSWLDRGPDAVALPLNGEYTRYGADGNAVASATVHVLADEAGNDLVSIGQVPDLALDLPSGTVVLDRDSGATWIVATSSSTRGRRAFSVAELASGESQGSSGGRSLALAGVGLVAFGCLVGVLSRRRPTGTNTLDGERSGA